MDILKLSGRLTRPPADTDRKLIRGIEMKKQNEGVPRELIRPYSSNSSLSVVDRFTDLFVVDSFKTIYENNLAPFHLWFNVDHVKKDYPIITDIKDIKKGIKNHFWNKKEAILVSKVLKNCKNQCYKCHKCDDLFGTPRKDSIIEFTY